ncbi:MAG: site-2 protease family protein [Dehalococcoidia bacterium]|nr:site-2 protease family protein [Dehalococcoidia bacterium]
MFGRSLTIARIKGIAIEVHPSWLLIFAVLSWSLAEGVFPNQYEDWSTTTYWVLGIIAALLLFVTVLVHELAHAVVAIRRGLPVPKITLFIFGGVSHMARQPRTAGEEFFIAGAGPLTSLVLAVLTGLAAWLMAGVIDQVSAVLAYLALVNFALAVFNILPGFPLDGGRVFRSIAWKKTGSFRKATRVASSVGAAFGIGLMVVGVGFDDLRPRDRRHLVRLHWLTLTGAARGESDNLKLGDHPGPAHCA